MNALRTIVIGIVLVANAPAGAEPLPRPLVETDWLAQHKKQVVMLDVRDDPKSFTARPRQRPEKNLLVVAGHIPGSVLIDNKDVRATREINGQKVIGMTPDRATFERVMRRAGVNQNSAIVVVTKGLESSDVAMATRLYWQLKYFGHDDVAVLNGGAAKWIAEGRPVRYGRSRPKPGNWRAPGERHELVATSEEVAKAIAGGSTLLVDNRPLGEYLGTAKRPYVHAKGHIPGAKWFPSELFSEDLGGAARFVSTEQLAHLLEELGIEHSGEIITYCNSGQMASSGWFVLSELLGRKSVRLYDGSMHQWTLEKRPVVDMKVE